MAKPLEVKPLSGYRLWLRYDDETSGEVDLSDLAGRGVFKAWDHQGFFTQVRIGPHGEITWSDDIDLCSDSLYMRLTKKSPEDVFPNLKTGVNA
ncbi:MAG: hypothetical protein NPIRA02_25180 [Nitrospirales bacterium]|nr:MAG: hypothetical protein NPIRA02_25180 [Nitrospirales bacterium]